MSDAKETPKDPKVDNPNHLDNQEDAETEDDTASGGAPEQ